MPCIVAFDLDDTLYTEATYLRSGCRAVAVELQRRAGVDGLAERVCQAMLEAPRRGRFEAAIATVAGIESLAGLSPADLSDIYDSHKPDITLAPSTIAVLDRLKALECIIAVITDGHSQVQHNKFQALGLDRWVAPEHLIVSGDTGYDKHSPRPFEMLRDRIGYDATYIYVGDNPAKDFHHPRLMGWHAVMLRDSAGRNVHSQDLTEVDPLWQPTLVIDNLNEIINLAIHSCAKPS